MYNKKQEQIAGENMSTKQMNNLKIEGRLVKQMQVLKNFGAPFTSCGEIDEFLEKVNIEVKVKVHRMKTEVMYARDTSLSVPKSNPVFRIRNMKVHGEKARQLTPQEFGDNLKNLMNKKLEALGKSVLIKAFVEQIDAIRKREENVIDS